MAETLFHLVPAADFETQSDATHYRAPSLATEGFIHLSTAQQVAGVAQNLYAEVDDMLVLTIDADALGDVRWEDTYGHGIYPHLHEPLSLDSVQAIAPYGRDERGQFPTPQ